MPSCSGTYAASRGSAAAAELASGQYRRGTTNPGRTAAAKGRTLFSLAALASRTASGRVFTQEDPIGLAGGLNLYGYAGGDPVNYSDPFGLCTRPGDPKCNVWMAVGASMGAGVGVLVAGGCPISSGGVCAAGAPLIIGSFAGLGSDRMIQDDVRVCCGRVGAVRTPPGEFALNAKGPFPTAATCSMFWPLRPAPPSGPSVPAGLPSTFLPRDQCRTGHCRGGGATQRFLSCSSLLSHARTRSRVLGSQDRAVPSRSPGRTRCSSMDLRS